MCRDVPRDRAIHVREKKPSDQAWIDRMLKDHWGGSTIVVHEECFDASQLPALIAGDFEGLLTYAVRAEGAVAEVISLNALQQRRGIGTALIETLASLLASRHVRILELTTTNDNLDALRFYQRRGFRIVRVRPDAVDAARSLKPTIPTVGDHNIALHDEIDLARRLI
jgi:GNAT superfamily N-acetyltransferase